VVTVKAQPEDWPGYLHRFHQQRPGITETVLSHCADRHGLNPYQWAARPIGGTGPVLDLACGSAPLWPHLPTRPYLGIDRSPGELTLAAARGAAWLVRADATALPVAEGTARVVVCAMALMIMQPLERILTEITRVLRDHGKLVALVPATRPLGVAGTLIAAGLVAATGPLRYPNDAALADPTETFNHAGLRLAADHTRRFNYRLTTTAHADALLDSLYLPGLPAWRVHAARTYLRALAQGNATVPVPIRRLVAVRGHQPA
jgi:SAM-dependent methyltransferase